MIENMPFGSFIKQIKLFEYQLPLKVPLSIGGRNIWERKGIIIQINSKSGFVGYGETAPLEGFSPESYDEAKWQLIELSKRLIGFNNWEILRQSVAFLNIIPDTIIAPSVLYGMDTAALSIFQKDIRDIFTIMPLHGKYVKVPINALLDISVDNLEKQLKKKIREGYKCIKVKVGRQSLADDIRMIQYIGKHIPSGVILRLDANQKWNLSSAIKFAQKVKEIPIEYIEEPCKNIDQFPRFYKETGMSVALDESLQGIHVKDCPIFDGLQALILKPTLIGGINRLYEYFELCKAKDINPILSSCFEAGPGFFNLLQAAKLVHNESIPHGLDTLQYFKQILFNNPFSTENGAISFNVYTEDFKDFYNLNYLEEIKPA